MACPQLISMGRRISTKQIAVGAKIKSQDIKNETRRLPDMVLESEMAALNTTFLMKMRDDVSTILEHEMFTGLLDVAPLEIRDGSGADSGHQDIFDEAKYRTAMKETGNYKCSNNLFAIHMGRLSNPGVPYRKSAVQVLKTHRFSRPTPFPMTLIIAVGTASEPWKEIGYQHNLAPEEMIAALVESIADRIKAGADATELSAWRTVLLTVSFHYKLLESDDARTYEAAQIREHVVVDYDSLAFTAKQMVYCIVGFKTQIEQKGGKQSDADIADRWNKNVSMAPSSETVTKTLVKNASDVFKKVLSDQATTAIIDAAEDAHGRRSPFNSIEKLYWISAKTSTTAEMKWALASISDFVANNMIGVSELSTRHLKGDGSGGRSIIELLILKFHLRRVLLTEILEEKKLPITVKATLRESLSSHDSYRKHFGYADTSADLHWQCGWPTSAVLYSRLVEDLVYDKTYDDVLKACIHKKKASPQEVLQSAGVSERMESFDEALAAELVPDADEAAGPEKAVVLHSSDSEGDAAQEDGLPDNSEDKLDAQGKATYKRIQLHANRLVGAMTKLEEEPKTQDGLTSIIREGMARTRMGNLSNEDDTRAVNLFFYTMGASGEAITNPSTRQPPMRAHYSKMLSAAVEAQPEAGRLDPNSIFIIFDAGKDRSEREFMAPFSHTPAEPTSKSLKPSAKSIPKSVCRLITHFDFDSLAEQKAVVRGVGTLRSVEYVYIVTAEPLAVPVKDRVKYAGTTACDLLGPVAKTPWHDAWKLPFHTKKDLYGQARIAVGGRTEGFGIASDSKIRATRKSQDRNEELPVFYHAVPENLLEEIVHTITKSKKTIANIWDFTPADGSLAHFCIAHRIPYHGFCFTDLHAKLLSKRLAKLVLEDFKTEKHPLHDVELTALMDEAKLESDEPEPSTTKPAPKPKTMMTKKKANTKTPSASQEQTEATKKGRNMTDVKPGKGKKDVPAKKASGATRKKGTVKRKSDNVIDEGRSKMKALREAKVAHMTDRDKHDDDDDDSGDEENKSSEAEDSEDDVPLV